MTLQLGSHGPLVSRWTDVMLKRFKSYALGVDGLALRNDAYFGLDEQKVQREYERRTNQPQDGVVSEHDLAALGLARPIIFTVEGHLSNPFVGPCAFVASVLEQQGVCWWQPVGYDAARLPFNNKSGRDELKRLLSLRTLDNGRAFPPGTPWGLLGFSQGAIITNQVFLNDIRPDNGVLHWRADSLTRAIAFGDPYREKNVDSGWWPDPPKPDTQGISDVRMTNTPHWWKSGNRTGDLYTENPDTEAGRNRTAIYKIAAENSWSGGPSGLLQRMMDFLTPTDDIIPLFQAIVGGVMFLGNMQSHGGYNLDAPIEYMRGVAKRP